MIDQRLGRRITDEVTRQLERNEVCRCRALRQDVEHIFGVFLSATGGQLVTEHHFSSGVVHLGTEDEIATLGWWHDRQAGECASDVDHVLLGVSAIDPKRMQFE